MKVNQQKVSSGFSLLEVLVALALLALAIAILGPTASELVRRQYHVNDYLATLLEIKSFVERSRASIDDASTSGPSPVANLQSSVELGRTSGLVLERKAILLHRDFPAFDATFYVLRAE